MKPFTTLTAVAAPIEMANIDTDRVIPVRFLRKLRSDKAAEVLETNPKSNSYEKASICLDRVILHTLYFSC